MNDRTIIREGYRLDDDWIDSQDCHSSDKENNADDNADDFDSIYEISDDDSQDDLPKTRSCISCREIQPVENFRYRSQRGPVSRRIQYSCKCEKCRKSHSLKTSANQRKKRERNGGRVIIRYVTWPEMMGFFEREAQVEYMLVFILLLTSSETVL